MGQIASPIPFWKCYTENCKSSEVPPSWLPWWIVEYIRLLSETVDLILGREKVGFGVADPSISSGTDTTMLWCFFLGLSSDFVVVLSDFSVVVPDFRLLVGDPMPCAYVSTFKLAFPSPGATWSHQSPVVLPRSPSTESVKTSVAPTTVIKPWTRTIPKPKQNSNINTKNNPSLLTQTNHGRLAFGYWRICQTSSARWFI